MRSLRKIILIILTFIIFIPISYIVIDYFYQRQHEAILLFKQSKLANPANRLATRFIADYDSGKIDSIVYKVSSFSFWFGHDKWFYNHTFFGKKTFSSCVDNSQSILVEQSYFFHNANEPISKFKVACDSFDLEAFNKIKMIRGKYLLNEIRGGNVYNFDNGISYFRGSIFDSSRAKLINVWIKRPSDK